MPNLDMPLDQLRTYQGRTPRPTDFDAFWGRALAELDATPPRLERTVAATGIPGVVCEELYYDGVGGARIHARLAMPARRDGPLPCILRFHGYTGGFTEWMELLAWVAQDYVVLAMDCRGQGGRSSDATRTRHWTLGGHITRGLEDGPEHLYFRGTYLDTAQLARIARALPEVDPGRVHAHGGSQGGALSIACAALAPGIATCTPVYPFLCDYRRVWEMDLAKDAYWDLRDWFRRFDPTHAREDEVFTRLGYIDLQFLAPRITARTLMFTGLMDAICPPSTQFAAYNRMTCQKEVVLYPDFGHENLPGHQDRVAAFIAG